jgi:hypothetical protein
MAVEDFGQRKRVNWQVPDYRPDKSNWPAVHQFMLQSVKDGGEFMEQSPGFQQLEESIRLLSGQPTDDLQKLQKNGYSKLQTSRLKRDLREMVNSLSEVRWIPGYHPSNSSQDRSANSLNKYGEHWYYTTFADLKIRKALQWMAISPCGWLEICYRQVPGKNKRVIDLIPHSAFDVVMTGVPESGDFQEAYTVTVVKDLPVYLAHALWPDFQKDLQPDRETPRGWLEKIKEGAKAVVADVFAQPPDKSTAKNPTCRLYYQYVIDLSINKSGKEMKMGFEKRTVKEPGLPDRTELVETPWSYTVPYVGQPIPKRRDASGEVVYKIATEEDARIFPGRRLLVGNEQKLFHDGPMWDWAGQVPLVKFASDSWPFGEFSMVHDLAPMQEAINEIERLIHQLIRRRYRPPMKYNYRAVDRTKAKAFNIDSDNRIGYNGQEGTGDNVMTPLMPKEFYAVEAPVFEFLKHLIESMDDQAGRQSTGALSKMKGMAGGDSLERLLELIGPIVKGIARDMERSLRDMAEMFKYLVYQYVTSPQLIRVTGEENAAPENFDFDPGNLIPSHLPDENKEFPSVYSRMQRAKWACENTPYLIQAGTAHEVTSMAQKLLYLQLFRAHAPIAFADVAEVLKLGNYGGVKGATGRERYRNEKIEDMEFQAQMMAMAQEITGQPGMPQQGGPGPKGGNPGGGRAPSGQTSPKLQQKGDGRPVVRESP